MIDKIINKSRTFLSMGFSILKRKAKETTEEKQFKFSKKVLIFSFMCIIIYTISVQLMNIKFGIEPNANLTDNVYKFFGLEVSLLMLKTIIDMFKMDKTEIAKEITVDENLVDNNIGEKEIK